MNVLLVVDMQNGFIKDDKHKELSKKIEVIVNSNAYDKIFATKFVNDRTKNSLYEDKLNWKELKTKVEQDFSLTFPKDVVVFEKNTYGLNQKDLKTLKSLKIDKIDICGVESDACVYAIALQLWDMGIYPNILINYVLGNIDMKPVFLWQFGKVDERK